jgi:two-component system invasion response regulator UvrY
MSGSPATPFEQLSQRELQVMMMVAQGKKIREISDRLCLSPKTVSTYRYRLFDKLGVQSDVELTHLVMRHGFLAH